MQCYRGSRARQHRDSSGMLGLRMDESICIDRPVGRTALWPLNAPAHACTGQGVEVQVLGSGGPELEDRRASSSYT